MRRRWAAVLLTTALVGVGCGGSQSDTVRPPLADPPDPGPPPASHGLSANEITRIAPSTVRVFGISCGRAAEGSGFAIAHDIIVTNAHVLLGVDDPTIEVESGLRAAADIVAFDAHNDLALLRVEDVRFEPLPLGTADDGTTGGVFGWEQGPTLEVTPFRVDRPVTVRIEAVGTDERVGRPSYLLAADIESGDSGAPLIDKTGTVVGIAYMSTTRDASVGYALRTAPVEDLLENGFEQPVNVPPCGVTTQNDGSAGDGS
jgi:S1-C subfamily serine protease